MNGNAPSDADYQVIRQLVYERSRINLGPDKRELVAARLGKRLRALQLNSYRDYIRYLQSPAGAQELQNLVDVISTNHTFFFREPQHFDFLEKHLLPSFLQATSRHTPLLFRVWSAACSSGEEPYSVAMCLDNLRWRGLNFEFTLDASDISTKILSDAKKGVYPEERLASLPLDLKRRYFQKGVGPYEGYYRVKQEIRDRIAWHQLNLFDPSWPFSHSFHLIFCRNVMIYFDRPSQEELVNRLARQLIPGGWLFIGHSESLNAIRHPFKAIAPAIYQLPGK